MKHEKKSRIKKLVFNLCIISFIITITSISGKKKSNDHLSYLKTEKIVYKSGKYLLDRSYHPMMGRESLSAFTLFSFHNHLYLGRKYGITIINTKTMLTRYLPIKNKNKYDFGTSITSIFVSDKNIWAAMNNGCVFKYSTKGRFWKKFTLGLSDSVSLTTVGGMIHAVTTKGIYFFNPITGLFHLNFKLPDGFPIKFIKIFQHKKWIYLCTSMGLMRYSLKTRVKWEMLGVRNDLTKLIVHDCSEDGNLLLIAASKVQNVFLPANIKITSYGTFYYNYFQKRWERKPWNVRGDLKLFMQINKSNTIIPEGGILSYNPLTDMCRRIVGPKSDFFKIINYKKKKFTAASRNGIYFFNKTSNSYVFTKKVLLKNLWIDDFVINSGKLAVLSGKRLYLYLLKNL